MSGTASKTIPSKSLPRRAPGGRLKLHSRVTVLDMTTSLAGPYAGQLWAHLGADFIKIERSTVGDDSRHWRPPELAGAVVQQRQSQQGAASRSPIREKKPATCRSIWHGGLTSSQQTCCRRHKLSQVGLGIRFDGSGAGYEHIPPDLEYHTNAILAQ